MQVTHYPLTSTVVATTDSNAIQQVFTGVSLVISASAYSTTGSEFDATLGDIRIFVYSGSNIIANFPYSQTDFYTDYTLAYATSSQPNGSIDFTTELLGININPNYYFKIVNSSSLEEILNVGIDWNVSNGTVPFSSSSKYNVTLYSGNSYINELYIYSGSNLISSITSSISASYTLNPTSSTYYQISADIKSSTTPTINWVQYEYHPSPWIDNDLYIDYVLLAGGYTGTSGSLTFAPSSSIYVNQNCQTTSGQTGSFRLKIKNETDAITLYDNTFTSVVTSYSNLQSFTFNALAGRIYSVTASSDLA